MPKKTESTVLIKKIDPSKVLKAITDGTERRGWTEGVAGPIGARDIEDKLARTEDRLQLETLVKGILENRILSERADQRSSNRYHREFEAKAQRWQGQLDDSRNALRVAISIIHDRHVAEAPKHKGALKGCPKCDQLQRFDMILNFTEPRS